MCSLIDRLFPPPVLGRQKYTNTAFTVSIVLFPIEYVLPLTFLVLVSLFSAVALTQVIILLLLWIVKQVVACPFLVTVLVTLRSQLVSVACRPLFPPNTKTKTVDRGWAHRGWYPTVILHVLIRPWRPDQWVTLMLPYKCSASNPWTDITRKSLKILHQSPSSVCPSSGYQTSCT